MLRKKLPIYLLIALLATGLSPLYGLFDVQAGVGIAGLSYIDDASAAASGKFVDTSLQALTFGFAGHVHTMEQDVICIGIGPYVVAGPGMRYSGDAGGTNVAFSSSQFMIGGEVYGKILATKVIFPYVKFGYGYDRLSTRMNLGASSAETKLNGSGYRILAGIEIPLTPLIGVFVEGGSTESSFSVSGVNVSGDKAKGGGYVFTIGLSAIF
ncbi:MAG: hypothetical protein JNJ69_07085 [Leptospiraceae bacterium]|nr:hypothetical protein [Leptospiraceae bacterium]